MIEIWVEIGRGEIWVEIERGEIRVEVGSRVK